jgi:dCTP deaminase
MIKNDNWILEQARQGMIVPFEPTSIRKAVLGSEEGIGQHTVPVLSWGVSSYGYDIRLSPHDFRNKLSYIKIKMAHPTLLFLLIVML